MWSNKTSSMFNIHRLCLIPEAYTPTVQRYAASIWSGVVLSIPLQTKWKGAFSSMEIEFLSGSQYKCVVVDAELSCGLKRRSSRAAVIDYMSVTEPRN